MEKDMFQQTVSVKSTPVYWSPEHVGCDAYANIFSVFHLKTSIVIMK